MTHFSAKVATILQGRWRRKCAKDGKNTNTLPKIYNIIINKIDKIEKVKID